jgi:hypothetical protein
VALDRSKVHALLGELDSNPGYARGSANFPRRISREEAAAVADEVHAAVEDFTVQRERGARGRGTPLACKAGCAYCCEEMIMVPAPETETVVVWLSREENRAVREAFLAAYPAWAKEGEPTADALADATEHGEMRAHQSAYLAYYRKRIPCAFNQNGMCTIYPVRPTVCRTAHAVGDPDACRADSPATPRRLDFVPLSQIVSRTNDLLIAAHHALRAPRGRPQSLCVSVHEALTERPR